MTRKPKPPYPATICLECGTKHGICRVNKWATWHHGTCDICGAATHVTEPRDFGHLKDGWDK